MRSPLIASVPLTGRRRGEVPGWLLTATAVAAGTELLVLRVLTRTAIHVPGLSDLPVVYVPISEVGRSAYYVAVVLLILTLVIMAADLLGRTEAAARAAGAGIVSFLIVAALARVGAASAATLDAAALVAVLLLAPWGLGALRGRSRNAAALLVAAFAVPAFAALQRQLAGSGAAGPDTWLTLGGEILAVGAAIASPLLVGARLGRPASVWGAVVGLATLVGLLVQGSTVEILMLWNLGLAGYLPPALYAIAAGAATYAIVGAFTTGRRPMAVGLALMFIGGIGLHSTYQTGLVLAGFVVLCTSEPLIEDP